MFLGAPQLIVAKLNSVMSGRRAPTVRALGQAGAQVVPDEQRPQYSASSSRAIDKWAAPIKASGVLEDVAAAGGGRGRARPQYLALHAARPPPRHGRACPAINLYARHRVRLMA
jgi:hypothetical protein